MPTAPTPASHSLSTAAEAHASPSWQHLRTTCRTAGELARQVHEGLRRGAAASCLIPLLQQEASLTHDIQLGIRELARTPLRSPSRSEHAELVTQMKSLLSMEEENHRLLRSRGMKISGPRQPRVIRRRRPRPGQQ